MQLEDSRRFNAVYVQAKPASCAMGLQTGPEVVIKHQSDGSGELVTKLRIAADFTKRRPEDI